MALYLYFCISLVTQIPPPSLEDPPAYLEEAPPEYPPEYFLTQNSGESPSLMLSDDVDTIFGSEASQKPQQKVNALLIHKLTDGLNSEQFQAVTAMDGHLLVLAGAGSGKTRVLTHRIAWLLAQGRARPPQILAVTFTNKAAKEMASRLRGLSINQVYSMWIGTFHGLCHRFLRLHHDSAGLASTFQVMDTDEQISVIRQVMEAKGINAEDFPPRETMIWINACKEKGDRANSIKTKGRESEIQMEIYQAYESYCTKENLVDFAELLLRTKEMLSRNERVREFYRSQFRYLLVDEFQDTNTMQYELLQLLCGEGASIFAVGDDDQSIYAFRGAKIENLRDFERRFAKGQVIRLEQSYRSTNTILKAANVLIANNAGRMGKTLWTAKKGGELIHVFPAYNDEEEAQWMMNEIRKLSDEGMVWSEVAILYRINAHSRAFEQAAIRAGIPYRIYGGFRFYDRAEIRHALAYLRLIANPNDATSLIRVINVPPRGIGERSMELLREIAEVRQCSLMSAIEFMEGRTATALFSFAQLINELRLAVSNKSLSEIMAHVVIASGLQAFYQNQRDGKERLENLDELQNAATQYEQERSRRALEGEEVIVNPLMPEKDRDVSIMPKPSPVNLIDHIEADQAKNAPLMLGQEALVRFLSDAVLDSAEPEASDKPAINMMSVHAAKGLEFSAVFIGGLEHGTFPHENNLDIEEERRLMYVALTRAKKYLRLSYTHQRLLHGRVRQNIPSIFLEEIPKESLLMLRSPSSVIAPESARSYGSGASGHWQKSANGQDRLKPRIGDLKGVGSSMPRDFQKNLESLGVTKGIPVSATMSEGESFPFSLGQNVFHPKFGAGVVYQYEGAGADTRILVSFGGLGQKWLLLSLAKLTAERV